MHVRVELCIHTVILRNSRKGVAFHSNDCMDGEGKGGGGSVQVIQIRVVQYL